MRPSRLGKVTASTPKAEDVTRLVGLLLGVPAAVVLRRFLVHHPHRRPTVEA